MIQFSKYKYISISISIVLIVCGFFITFFVNNGFAHSLDFNGGLRTIIKMDAEMSRKKLEDYFKSKKIDVVIIQLNEKNNTYQIDIGLEGVASINKMNSVENSAGANTYVDSLFLFMQSELKVKREDILSSSQVGAVIGDELAETGVVLLLSTILIILLYLSFRFQFKYALGASVALLHDLFFTLAIIGAFQIKPSVPLIAALLTILGYSINDTIVVFDRIRENVEGKLQETFSSIIDVSINQTLGRTINTSVATLISLVAIIFGGAVELYDFAIVLIAGIFVGTYSSIFIAAPVIEIYDNVRRKS